MYMHISLDDCVMRSRAGPSMRIQEITEKDISFAEKYEMGSRFDEPFKDYILLSHYGTLGGPT